MFNAYVVSVGEEGRPGRLCPASARCAECACGGSSVSKCFLVRRRRRAFFKHVHTDLYDETVRAAYSFVVSYNNSYRKWNPATKLCGWRGTVVSCYTVRYLSSINR